MPNDILAGLQGLGAYLKDENKLRKEEFEQEKQKISAQRIATGFKSLTAYNSESDARQLVYSLIDDAASLDSLSANLPLIDSLYKDSVAGIKNYKAEKQDSALREYAQSEYGIDNAPADLTGAQVLDLAKTNKTFENRTPTVNQQGQHILKTTNAKGQVIHEMLTDERTDLQQKELDFKYSRKLAGYQHGLNNSIKAYAGLTEGGLPLMMGQDGLYVQTGGKLIKYDETLHGSVNKGNSYNTPNGGFKTYEDQFDYYKKQNKDAFVTTNSLAESLASILDITPKIDATGKEIVSDYSSAILNKYGDKKALWNDIYAKIPGQDDNSKARREQLYNTMQEFYRSSEELKSTKDNLRKGAAEQEYQLPIGSFGKVDSYAYNLLSQDVSQIPDEYRSEEGIVSMIELTPEGEERKKAQEIGMSWLIKNELLKIAAQKDIVLRTPEEYQNFYNKLGYKGKAKLFKNNF